MLKPHAPPAGSNGAAAHSPVATEARASEPEVGLPALDALSEELNRLAAINAELVGQLRRPAVGGPSAGPASPADDEVEFLRQQNAELLVRIEELEAGLAAAPPDKGWGERQREYESLLEEKSEVIRSLHVKIQELQEGTKRRADEPVPPEEALLELQKELEEQRQQIQDDEESMMAQMREMELALSKDRAELARQRQEVQRLQAELNREIELAGRDPALRDRLNSLRRGNGAVTKEPASSAKGGGNQQGSGLLRRLFG